MSSKKDINQKKYKIFTKRNYRNYKKSQKKKGGFGIKSAVAVAALAGLAAGNLAATESQKSNSAIEKANKAHDEEEKKRENDEKKRKAEEQAESKKKEAIEKMNELLSKRRNPYLANNLDPSASQILDENGLKDVFTKRYNEQMEQTLRNRFSQYQNKENLSFLNVKTFNQLNQEFKLNDDEIYFFKNNQQLFSDLWENKSKSSSSLHSSPTKNTSSGNRTEEQFKTLKAELLEKHKQGLHPEKRLFNEVKSHKYYDKEYEVTDREGDIDTRVKTIKIDESKYKDIKDDKIKDNGKEYVVYNGKGYLSEQDWLKDKEKLKLIILAYNKVNEKGGFFYTIQNYTGSFWERVMNEFLHPTTD